jgi:hypothetical protein
MKLEIWVQDARVPWEDDEESHKLLSWRYEELPARVLESNFEEALNESQAMVRHLRGQAALIEDTDAGMPVAVFLEHVASRINKEWQVGPMGHHVIERETFKELVSCCIDWGSVVERDSDGVVRIVW